MLSNDCAPTSLRNNTRIKICGLTTPVDAQHAIDAGADYLGINFIARSKRCVTPEELLPWLGDLGTGAKRVALFQNAEANDVERVLNQVDFDVIQFHGTESKVFCEQFTLPYWKAVSMSVSGSALGESFNAVADDYDSAEALVLDAVTIDAAGNVIAGGTGKQFDWALWPRWSDRTLWLAGGLDADNVAAGIEATRPWGVDVASGVESSPGRKDPNKIESFCRAVKRSV